VLLQFYDPFRVGVFLGWLSGGLHFDLRFAQFFISTTG